MHNPRLSMYVFIKLVTTSLWNWNCQVPVEIISIKNTMKYLKPNVKSKTIMSWVRNILLIRGILSSSWVIIIAILSRKSVRPVSILWWLLAREGLEKSGKSNKKETNRSMLWNWWARLRWLTRNRSLLLWMNVISWQSWVILFWWIWFMVFRIGNLYIWLWII